MALGRNNTTNELARNEQADYLNALKEEYRRYVNAGYADGVKNVAAELHILGHDVKERAVPVDAIEKAVESERPRRPRKPAE